MSPVVVLVGAPGAGKTTVAALLADRLGVEVLDTDHLVEQRAGTSISEIFVEQGEEAFRALERRAVADGLASHDGVLALGGGAVLDPRTRELLADAPVVWLRVGVGAAASRVGLNQARPLLLGNVRAQLTTLLAERTPLYAQVATHTVDTDDRAAPEVAAVIVDLLSTPPGATRIQVGRRYDVLVGHGVRAGIADTLGGARRVALIHPPTLGDLASSVAGDLASYDVLDVPVPDGEAAKTAETAASIWGQLGRAGFTRSDAVVGLGGGATTDLAGFVAATWLRGVRLVTVPTTLLGMVDAAVGGKTGINTAEGKNLVGAFHEPAAVLADLDLLATLPRVDLVAGLAEVVKVGFTSDPAILDIVEKNPEAATVVGGSPLRELVERAIAVKAAVVADDLREARLGGLGREVLNYGHTFAHAVEQVEHYTWRHGEAVSVGVVYVAALARLAGVLDESTAVRHAAVLSSLGLPTTYAPGRWAELDAAMAVDKKTRGSVRRFVVIHGVGEPALLEGPDPALLEAAYAEVSG